MKKKTKKPKTTPRWEARMWKTALARGTVTLAQAKRRLNEEPNLRDFKETVLLVTVDSVLWCSAAIYRKMGDYHLVWTEHHGNFLEHDDEVVKLHVTVNDSVSAHD